MDKTLLFSISLVFCFGKCITSAKEGSEVDLITSQSETVNHTPVDTAANKEFPFNGSDAEAARADGECKCKNGKCMRACDVEKITPCMDKRMVCVCNPEFGKKGEGECEYCDCGQGFNCTFDYWSSRGYWVKNCKCPKEYYEDFDNRCKAECSHKRPCLNGGTCSYKRCDCPRGTLGALCEEILDCSECVNRLEVDCLYDQSKEESYCSCKNSSLYYDYDLNICKPCPCENGDCEYEISDSYKKLKCNCHFGYKEFNGYCKKCECDYRTIGGCEFDSKGERICNKCPDGFYERNGLCLLCGCTMWSDLDTKCEMVGNVKRCFCNEGFEDINGHCEDIDECETNNTCHPSTTCHDTLGSFRCECPEGYKGYDYRKVKPGEVCEDVNECEESSTACWYWDNVKCVNLPGSYKCECFPGYEPRSYSDEPYKTTCVKTRKHWGPSVIVVCTTLVLIAVFVLVHKRVKNRAARSN